MPKELTKFSIFLSSPSDLGHERSEIPQVISELNYTYGNANNIHFELLKWETHSAPGISREYTQQLINQDIGNDYDIFIGIIWKKFGTKTASAESGTEEEFLNALARFENGENIQILFYFKTEPIPVEEIEPEQITKIKNFQRKLKDNEILYWNFANVEELKNQLRMHIAKRTESLLENREEPIIVNSQYEIDTLDSDDPTEFGILDFVIQFDDYLANAMLSLNNIIEATKTIAEEFKNKTSELERLQRLPNYKRDHVVGILSRTAKSIDNYSTRLAIEIPPYRENFEAAIRVGTLYLNGIAKDNIGDNQQDLNTLLEAIKSLKQNIPHAMRGISAFHSEINQLPSLYSVFSRSKNNLSIHLEKLNNILKHSYNLTHEFIGEIEYKLNL